MWLATVDVHQLLVYLAECYENWLEIDLFGDD